MEINSRDRRNTPAYLLKLGSDLAELTQELREKGVNLDNELPPVDQPSLRIYQNLYPRATDDTAKAALVMDAGPIFEELRVSLRNLAEKHRVQRSQGNPWADR